MLVGETDTTGQSEAVSSGIESHRWYRSENGKSYLRFLVTILNPDGSIAKGVDVKARSKDPMQVTDNGEEYLVEYEIQAGFQPGLRVLATSSDGKLIGHYAGGYDEMTHDAKHGVTIRLKPSREVTVLVVDEGQPVSDATVGIDWTGGFELFSQSNTEGEAKFYVAADTKLYEIGVRTDDGRIGGYQFSRKPVRDPFSRKHEVELHPCKGRTIRVVNEQNEPIPNLGFELHVADKKNYNYIPLFDEKYFTTDEKGEAFCAWFPDWEEKDIHTYIDDLSDTSWSKTQDDGFEEEALVSRLEQNEKLKRVTVAGRVLMPEGMEHCFLIKMGSFEHPQEGRYDSVQCRTDSQGNFSADVMPGATYCAFINDVDWVSDYWAAIPFDPDTGETKTVELNIMKGEPVEIIATAGPNRMPLRNLKISLRQGHDFDWFEEGERHSGSLGRQWWVETDENGRATTYANVGEISGWPSQTDWRPEFKNEVKQGDVTQIKLHRASPGKRMIKGTVLAPMGQEVDLSALNVRLLPMDGESRDEATATPNANGNFHAELSAAIVGATVKTSDGNWFAAVISKNPDEGIELQLQDTTTFRGTYQTSEGDPIAGKWVRIEPNFRNAELDKNSPYAYSGDTLDPIETVTDKQGNFELVGVPYGIPLLLRCEYATATDDPRLDASRGKYLGTRLLTRGEKRPAELLQTSGAKAPEIESLENYVSDKLTDCRLMGARLLVLLQGGGDQSLEFVRRNFYDADETPDLLSYLPLWLDGPKAKPDMSAYLEKQGWPVPGQDEMLLVVLDPESGEVERLQLNTNAADASSIAKQFITNNKARKKDALKNYTYALALAKRTDRKVWIRLSQTRCGPCFRFARWLDRNQAELEKGFVLLKVDNLLDANGQEMAKKMMGEENFGIPYHQILDGDGNVLIDSQGPLGNIGHPSTFEAITHLKRMLAVHPGYSQEQIDALAKDALKSR